MIEEQMEFGIPHIGEINRKTVVVVIFNPKTHKFLYCDWPEYGLCCLVSGGVEKGEGYMDAAIREIKEETGYQNFTIVAQLGGKILTHYYMGKKKEYRAKEIQSYLVILQDTKKSNTNLEEDEQFVLKEASYTDLVDLMRGYKNIDGGGLEDHIEILKRGKSFLASQGVI